MLDGARYILAIEAATCHYGDIQIAENVGCGNDAAVPKAIDARACARLAFRAGFIRDGGPERAANEAHDQRSDCADKEQCNSLPERETVS